MRPFNKKKSIGPYGEGEEIVNRKQFDKTIIGDLRNVDIDGIVVSAKVIKKGTYTKSGPYQGIYVVEYNEDYLNEKGMVKYTVKKLKTLKQASMLYKLS